MAKRKSDAEKVNAKKKVVAEVTKYLTAKNEKPETKMGRPSIYSDETAKTICKKIATSVHGIRRICDENPELPCVTTIMTWLFEKPEFLAQYDAAKRHQANLFVDQIMDIANDSSFDVIENEEGQMRMNSEFVARSRLKIDSIKWIACKLLPKVYGDKVQNETVVTISHEKAVEALG